MNKTDDFYEDEYWEICVNCSRIKESEANDYCQACTDDMLEQQKGSYFLNNLHYVCSACRAHVKASNADYDKWGKRCETCYEQDIVAIYPFNSYSDVYEAIMSGQVLIYKIAEGFFLKGQLITIGVGNAKQELPAITNENGQPIEYGEKAVQASIRRTYPQFWRVTDA